MPYILATVDNDTNKNTYEVKDPINSRIVGDTFEINIKKWTRKDNKWTMENKWTWVEVIKFTYYFTLKTLNSNVQEEFGEVPTRKTKIISHWPHMCKNCGHPSYNGAVPTDIDCSNVYCRYSRKK